MTNHQSYYYILIFLISQYYFHNQIHPYLYYKIYHSHLSIIYSFTTWASYASNIMLLILIQSDQSHIRSILLIILTSITSPHPLILNKLTSYPIIRSYSNHLFLSIPSFIQLNIYLGFLISFFEPQKFYWKFNS